MAITFTPAALRQWLKLNANTRARIKAKLDKFAETGVGDVKRLKGRAGSRRRIGDWRNIFYSEGNMIVIAAVGHRREIYD
jgi:mRNA interferase RelE/StbE